MTSIETPTVAMELGEAIRQKLASTPAPLKLAEVVKGLPKPKKVKVPEFQAQIRTLLEEEIRLGRLYSCPSGKNGEVRYWARDEQHWIREALLEIAAVPQTLANLRKAVKGVDAGFIETILRDLIEQDRLFQHPPKTVKGGPLLANFAPPPPPPPLEQPKQQKAFAKLIADCRKLLISAGATEEELLSLLRRRLLAEPSMEAPASPVSQPKAPPTPQESPSLPNSLVDLILKACQTSPVVNLAGLRREMPQEYQGAAFDQAVLRLAEQGRVVLHVDANAEHFSNAERAELVRDGESYFTMISLGS